MEGKIFGTLRIPTIGEKKLKYMQIQKFALKKTGNLDKIFLSGFIQCVRPRFLSRRVSGRYFYILRTYFIPDINANGIGSAPPTSSFVGSGVACSWYWYVLHA